MGLSILGDGIQYYIVEVGFWDDDKIVSMEKKLGEVYCARLMKLIDRIYSNGYFLKWDAITKKTFCESKGYNPEDIQLMIDYLLDIDFLDDGIYRTYGIITSKTIQKIFLNANPRKKGLKLIWEYCALDADYYASTITRTIILQSLLKKPLDFNDLPDRFRKEKTPEEEREDILSRLDAILAEPEKKPELVLVKSDVEQTQTQGLTPLSLDEAFEFSNRNFETENDLFKKQIGSAEWLKSYNKFISWIKADFVNIGICKFQVTYQQYRQLFANLKFTEDEMYRTLKKLSISGNFNEITNMHLKIDQYVGFIREEDGKIKTNKSSIGSGVPMLYDARKQNPTV